MSDAPLSEKQIRDTLAAYLGLLQRHVSAEEMMSKILTDDFVEVAGRSDDEVEIKTRLEFFLRRWEPPSPTSDKFTGWAFTPGSCAGPPASPNGASPRSSWMDSTTSTTTQSASSRPPRRG